MKGISFGFFNFGRQYRMADGGTGRNPKYCLSQNFHLCRQSQEPSITLCLVWGGFRTTEGVKSAEHVCANCCLTLMVTVHQQPFQHEGNFADILKYRINTFADISEVLHELGSFFCKLKGIAIVRFWGNCIFFGGKIDKSNISPDLKSRKTHGYLSEKGTHAVGIWGQRPCLSLTIQCLVQQALILIRGLE